MCGAVHAHVTFHYHQNMQDGFTALIGSATNDHLEVVRLLLDSKAEIHEASKVLQFTPPFQLLLLD